MRLSAAGRSIPMGEDVSARPAPAPAARPAGLDQVPKAPAAAPAPAAPVDPLAAFRASLTKAQADANRPESEYLKDVKEGIPENVAAADYRKQVMAERANSKDEAERLRWMRSAQFFAKWGSTPGPTLVAGMNALQEAIPNLIADEKDQKKAKREADKIIYELDNATRLEELGYKKEARGMKEKAAERAANLNQYMLQAQTSITTAETSAGATRYSADQRLLGDKIQAEQARLGRLQQAADARDQKFISQYNTALNREATVLQAIATERSKKSYTDLVRTSELPGEAPNVVKMREAAKARLEEIEKSFTERANMARRESEAFRAKAGMPALEGTGGFDPSRLSGDDRAAYEWAQKNPTDARSAAIMKRLKGE